MIATPKREPRRSMRRVVLTKRDGTTGLPIGAEYAWTYTTAPRERAVVSAFRALRRDYPDENAACWEALP